MAYRVVPEIAGRLIVGDGHDFIEERPATHMIDLRMEELAPDVPPRGIRWYQEATEGEDLDRRVATLRWYMRESDLVGTVFYIFPGDRAWETAAACLRARYDWQPKRIEAVFKELGHEGTDLAIVDATYKAWLERGSGQTS